MEVVEEIVCPKCHQDMTPYEGFNCLACGKLYHDRCLPVLTGGSDIICQQCIEEEQGEG